jgi:short-subunit dehydrogenase
MFAEALRHELAGSGVSVTTVYPGEIRTSLHAHEQSRMPDWYRGGPNAATAEALAKRIVRAVEYDERHLHYRALVKGMAMLNGLSPGAADAVLRRLRGTSSAPRRD